MTSSSPAEPVSMLTIRGGPSATNMSTWRTVTYQQTAAPADLVFHAVEGSNTGTGFFECVAEGGYPARVLSVELPDRDLTAHLTKGSNETYEGDVDGLMVRHKEGLISIFQSIGIPIIKKRQSWH